jgi:hypothetical protein
MANAVINEILRQGQNQPRRYVLAALTTGKVESNFRNLPGGDRDSIGWRQERASLYRNPRNLKASVRRFYQEAAQHDRGQGVGELAADVQRPASQYRGRYAQVLPEAKQILASGGTTTGGGGGRRASLSFSPGQSVDLAALLSSARDGGAGPPQPGATAPAAPAFSASAVMPEAYQGTPSAGAPQPASDPLTSALSELAAALPNDLPKVNVTGGGGGGGGIGGGAQIHELFWNGPGARNIDEGKAQPKGFVSGHKDHVHLAADKPTMRAAAKLAKRLGLNVGEYGEGIKSGHAEGSFHYQPFGAMDVSGSTAAMRKFARLVARARA